MACGGTSFSKKIDNSMMLAQSKSSMKEHHHVKILTIDYDMLDILSVPYSSPVVIRGKWRIPKMKKNILMMEDELLAIKERAALIQIMKKQIQQSQHNVNTI